MYLHTPWTKVRLYSEGKLLNSSCLNTFDSIGHMERVDVWILFACAVGYKAEVHSLAELQLSSQVARMFWSSIETVMLFIKPASASLVKEC